VTRKPYGRLLGSFQAKEHGGGFCVEDRASRRLDRAEQTPITLIAPVNGAFGRCRIYCGCVR
jgi:hypothetical protein